MRYPLEAMSEVGLNNSERNKSSRGAFITTGRAHRKFATGKGNFKEALHNNKWARRETQVETENNLIKVTAQEDDNDLLCPCLVGGFCGGDETPTRNEKSGRGKEEEGVTLGVQMRSCERTTEKGKDGSFCPMGKEPAIKICGLYKGGHVTNTYGAERSKAVSVERNGLNGHSSDMGAIVGEPKKNGPCGDGPKGGLTFIL
ncbi:hypothetical protein HAX54_034928 [Datura stramonium]|uniref:Uncharacterized protein n=1 Tax=Datura stramonium TaxID=4076 RepID=A0ABS8VHY3_DATST|nr:hypothetical protein [Datura stramonium]